MGKCTHEATQIVGKGKSQCLRCRKIATNAYFAGGQEGNALKKERAAQAPLQDQLGLSAGSSSAYSSM